MTDHNDTLTQMRLANPADAVEPGELISLRAAIDEEIAAPTSQRRKPSLRWQPHPAFAAVVALVVILALFLPLRYVGQRDDTGDAAATTPPPSSVTSSATPSTTPPATLAPVPAVTPLSVDPRSMQWRRVDMPGLSGGYLYFDSVIAGGPGLIAVGSPNRSGDFIWTSEDGVDWAPASVDRPGYAFDVTAGGPGYVAVGSSIWISSDGVSWSQPAFNDPIVGELRAVTVGGPGLVAVGTFNLNRAWIYTSTDGVQWSLIPEEVAPVPAIESGISVIVAGGPGLVAVGHYGDVGAVWNSKDGFEWSRVPVDRAVFGYGGTEILNIAADDSGLMAVGMIANDRNTNYDTMGIWRSTDGISWSVVPVDPQVITKGTELRSIISTEQGFIAGGMTENNAAGAWFSPHGTTWTRLDTGDAFGGVHYQVVTDIAVFNDRLIAVGWESDPNYEDEALWYESEVVWIGELVEE